MRREVYLIDKDEDHNQALASVVDDSVKTIDAWLSEGRTVVVHCHGGASRTGLVLRAWLMRKTQVARDKGHFVPERLLACPRSMGNGSRVTTTASWSQRCREFTTPVWDSNHTKSAQPVLRSDVTDSLLVAAPREGGVRKQAQPTSETLVAIRT